MRTTRFRLVAVGLAVAGAAALPAAAAGFHEGNAVPATAAGHHANATPAGYHESNGGPATVAALAMRPAGHIWAD